MRHPMKQSLQKATEALLTWPPVVKRRPPHPAILDWHADIIKEDLRKRMLSIVELKEQHILICSQGEWPRHLFYFIRGLRDLLAPSMPIVILHPCVPNEEQWGLVGIFEDVWFIKGSPIYELDLMRGGILMAGMITKF